VAASAAGARITGTCAEAKVFVSVTSPTPRSASTPALRSRSIAWPAAEKISGPSSRV
jgi:hypothetical protein